ncbi:MAG: hypothetical protein P8X86_06475 [Desulfofustis sp.]|jgi:hypothetical protein
MRTTVNIVLLVCCIITIPYLGLFTTVGIYLAAHMFFLGVRPIALVGLVALGSVLVMYGFFGLLLGVRLSGALLV